MSKYSHLYKTSQAKNENSSINSSRNISCGDSRFIPRSVVVATRVMRDTAWPMIDVGGLARVLPSALRILGYMYPFVLKGTYFFQSQGLIAENLGVSRRQVLRAFKQLEGYGFIRRYGRYDEDAQIRTTNAYVLHPNLLDKTTLAYLAENYPDLGLNFYHTKITPIERLQAPLSVDVATEYKRVKRVILNYNIISPLRARVRIKNQGFRVDEGVFTPTVAQAITALNLTTDQAAQFMQFPDAIVERVIGEFSLRTDIKKPYEWCLQRAKNMCTEKNLDLRTHLVEKICTTLSLQPYPSSSKEQLAHQARRNASLLSAQNELFHKSISTTKIDDAALERAKAALERKVTRSKQAADKVYQEQQRKLAQVSAIPATIQELVKQITILQLRIDDPDTHIPNWEKIKRNAFMREFMITNLTEELTRLTHELKVHAAQPGKQYLSSMLTPPAHA